MIIEYPSISIKHIEHQALKNKFSVAYSQDNSPPIMIYDRKTRGKATCLITYKDGKVEARYMND